MSNRRKLRNPRHGELPQPAAVRIQMDGCAPDVATYLLTRASAAAELVADAIRDGNTAEVLERGALPVTEAHAPALLAEAGPGGVLTIGTTEGGKWSTWHPPFPQEPVPGSSAWHAAHDQAEAARADALGLAGKIVDRGARYRESEPGAGPPAFERMFARFEAGIQTGQMCRHKSPQSTQLTHMFGAQPDMRLCDRCAQAPMAALSSIRRCDLCGKHADDPTVLRAVRGWLVFHMVLCDACYPEGADAPRVGAKP